MNENLAKGALTEQKCILKCIELGYTVSKPIFDNARYDLIVDTGNKLLKVQVKTSRWTTDEHDAFTFNCKSTHSISNGNKIMPYTKDEIDVFMTEKDNVFYLIPVEGNTSQKTLRIIPPKSGQIKGLSFAKDYVFEEVIKNY